jgi:hypothetical protein
VRAQEALQDTPDNAADLALVCRRLDDVGPPLSLTLAVQQPICLERLHMHALPSSASTSAHMRRHPA